MAKQDFDIKCSQVVCNAKRAKSTAFTAAIHLEDFPAVERDAHDPGELVVGRLVTAEDPVQDGERVDRLADPAAVDPVVQLVTPLDLLILLLNGAVLNGYYQYESTLTHILS